MLKLRMKFHGPFVITNISGTSTISMGSNVTIITESIHDRVYDIDNRRVFEMEQTFNELTKGRLHVEIIDE